MRRDAGGQIGGCVERIVDLGGVAMLAVEDPAEGELEAIAATAALEC